jgi:hypothetical protein
MKTLAIATASACVLTLAASAASAAVISFANFDDLGGGPAATFFDVGVADGWTEGVGTIEIQHDNVAGNAFSQPNLVELDSNSNSSMFFNLAAGNYTVDWFYSPRPGVAASSNGIELTLGATLLDSITGDGAGDTVWQHRSVTFSTTGGALTFAAVGTSDSLGGYLDNITITQNGVPEPASWALMIAGFGLAGATLRRRLATT